ncbi:MAG TPA: M3 family metallopeptidase [Candidatus Paceibacterota bacterium]|jgi:Zn-dependent oligopeptidase
MATPNTEQFLNNLNSTFLALHKAYEDLFWVSYMGDRSVDAKKDAALTAIDAFRSDPDLLTEARRLLADADRKSADRLGCWVRFFETYQLPSKALAVKERIVKLESKILKKRASAKEGYIDPYSKKFVPASSLRMNTMLATHEDEKMRKACFDAREELALNLLNEYVELVPLRNEFARELGFADFYDYKLRHEDGMTKEELFGLFEQIYEKTKQVFAEIRAEEKVRPGLRKPWNFSYMLAGDFTKEEDPYFQFEDALPRWGRSFQALGIGYRGGRITLDLLDRKGKWNNGFCHWPDLVHFKGNKRIPGTSNFTCNLVAGQVGSGVQGYNTLFHEGGHAAHLLNVEETETCLNHEYAPMSMGWSETQSMFLDTLFSSIEWRVRYAKDAAGNPYPLELYERKSHAFSLLRHARFNSIMFVADFERQVYEAKTLTRAKVLAFAKKSYSRYYDHSKPSLRALMVPHIYSWESSAAYHGYGLAELALTQWRAYLYKKYGYIVDNPKVGKEMREVWKFGSRYTYAEFVKIATGKKLSAKAFIDEVNAKPAKKLRLARERVARLARVKQPTGPIRLDAEIRMTHGTQEVANNAKSFEDMAARYAKWLRGQAKG